jgi:transposase
MRALEAEVVDAIWTAVASLLPPSDRSHPLGCHRPRVPDRLCFRGIIIRLVTGASWVDIEAILEHRVSDTTLRARRDEWIDAGVFELWGRETLAALRQRGRRRGAAPRGRRASGSGPSRAE